MKAGIAIRLTGLVLMGTLLAGCAGLELPGQRKVNLRQWERNVDLQCDLCLAADANEVALVLPLSEQERRGLPDNYRVSVEWEMPEEVYGVMWVEEERVGSGTRRLMRGDVNRGVKGDFYEHLAVDESPSVYERSLRIFMETAKGAEQEADGFAGTGISFEAQDGEPPLIYRWRIHAIDAQRRPIVAEKRILIQRSQAATPI
jgi:hypothetical protein